MPQEVSELFQRYYNLNKGVTARSSLMADNVAKRIQQNKMDRRTARHNLLISKRNISLETESSDTTPAPKYKESVITKRTNAASVAVNEKLAQWKEKRLQLKEAEKKKSKPIFKVFHISKEIGLPNLDKVNKEIKGKPIKPTRPIFSSSFVTKEITKDIQPSKTTTNVVNAFNRPQVCKFKSKVTGKENIEVNTQSYSDRTKKTSSQLRLAQDNNHKNVLRKYGKLATRGKTLDKPKHLHRDDYAKLQNNKVAAFDVTVEVDKENIDNNLKNIIEKSSQLLTVQEADHINCISDRKRSLRSFCRQSNVLGSSQIMTNDENTTLAPPLSVSMSKTPTSCQLPSVFYSDATTTPKSHKKTRKRNTPITIDGSMVQTPRTGNKYHASTESIDSTRKDTPTRTPAKRTSRRTPLSTKTTTIEDGLNVTMTPRRSSRTQYTQGQVNNDNKTIDVSKMQTELAKTSPLTSMCEMEKSSSTSSDGFNNTKLTPVNESKSSTDSPHVYISPFVTVSRGKTSARHEFRERKQHGGSFNVSSSSIINNIDSIVESTQPRAGAVYFSDCLANEGERLSNLCNHWSGIKESDNADVPEDVHDSINAAIGQAQLLMSQKFEHFSQLIEQSIDEDRTAFRITCEDLHGYWDGLSYQIRDIDKRFERLEKMRHNEWVDIVPNQVNAPPSRIKLKTKTKINEVKRKPSVLRNAIRLARQKRQQENGITVDTNESERRSIHSPGLTMMKVTLTARTQLPPTPPPNKSILKKFGNTQSVTKKVVLFKENQNYNDAPGGLQVTVNKRLTQSEPRRKCLNQRQRISPRLHMSKMKLF